MRILALPATGLGAVLALALSTLSANAQATRTWIAGAGSDVNPCSLTAPCKTLAGAFVKTAAGGEINCIDANGVGSLTINKSIAINCENTLAGVLATGGVTGFIVNAGATDIVTLRGLDVEGAGTGNIGISVLQVGALHVQNLKIRNFRNNGAAGNGISFAPTNAGAELHVSDTTISDSGTLSGNAGILVRPTGAGGAKVMVSRTQLENNSTGVRIDGTASTGGIRVHLKDNTISGSTNNGVMSTASTAVTSVFLEGNGIFANQIGVQSDGANSFMQISGNTITSNFGLGISGTAGGQLQSYVNNNITGNSGGDGVTVGANLTPK